MKAVLLLFLFFGTILATPIEQDAAQYVASKEDTNLDSAAQNDIQNPLNNEKVIQDFAVKEDVDRDPVTQHDAQISVNGEKRIQKPVVQGIAGKNKINRDPVAQDGTQNFLIRGKVVHNEARNSVPAGNTPSSVSSAKVINKDAIQDVTDKDNVKGDSIAPDNIADFESREKVIQKDNQVVENKKNVNRDTVTDHDIQDSVNKAKVIQGDVIIQGVVSKDNVNQRLLALHDTQNSEIRPTASQKDATQDIEVKDHQCPLDKDDTRNSEVGSKVIQKDVIQNVEAKENVNRVPIAQKDQKNYGYREKVTANQDVADKDNVKRDSVLQDNIQDTVNKENVIQKDTSQAGTAKENFNQDTVIQGNIQDRSKVIQEDAIQNVAAQENVTRVPTAQEDPQHYVNREKVIRVDASQDVADSVVQHNIQDTVNTENVIQKDATQDATAKENVNRVPIAQEDRKNYENKENVFRVDDTQAVADKDNNVNQDFVAPDNIQDTVHKEKVIQKDYIQEDKVNVNGDSVTQDNIPDTVQREKKAAQKDVFQDVAATDNVNRDSVLQVSIQNFENGDDDFLNVVAIKNKRNSIHDFAIGNRKFTSAVYKAIARENKDNFVFSPFSAETILALTSEGTRGTTNRELITALFLPISKIKTRKAFQALSHNIKSNQDLELLQANRIYTVQDVSLKNNFRELAEEVYNSEVKHLNITDPDKAAHTINRWVESTTNNKIKHLIDAGDIDSETNLILVNAIYFNGAWKQPFSLKRTSERVFYNSEKRRAKVPTMHIMAFFNYYENSKMGAKFLQLPYKGENINMVIALPKKKYGLEQLEANIKKVFQPHPWSKTKISLQLPKFRSESTTPFTDILKSLGVTKLFTHEADFSGMATDKSALYVSDVFQKAFIDVSESGTEAAAATTIIHSKRRPTRFHVNHPFIYYIEKDGVVLFAGRVNNLKSKK